MRPKRTIGSGQLWFNICGANGKKIIPCRCCWLATKPYSDYEMIETQVMLTPKKKFVDVTKMHLEYKWTLPINHGTDFPAYSDTGYSDTPLTVTFLTGPKWHFIRQK